jgi:hypothetical protein
MSVAFDYTMRLLGPCLIVLALGLLSSVTYLYFLVLLPLLLGPQVGPAHVLHGAFALLLLVNVFFNYLLCVSTSPGSPRQPCDPQTADLMEANRQGGLTMDPRSWSYCKKCRVPRPPRCVRVCVRTRVGVQSIGGATEEMRFRRSAPDFYPTFDDAGLTTATCARSAS